MRAEAFFLTTSARNTINPPNNIIALQMLIFNTVGLQIRQYGGVSKHYYLNTFLPFTMLIPRGNLLFDNLLFTICPATL